MAHFCRLFFDPNIFIRALRSNTGKKTTKIFPRTRACARRARVRAAVVLYTHTFNTASESAA